jgi:MFS family permease
MAQAFVHELILIYPVYAIMMLETGLSGFGLSALFVLWALSSLLFEIPSGVVGDLVNRKKYLCLGAGIKSTGFLVWLVWPELIGYAMGFVLWSLGSAIRSGTQEALLHDALAEQQRNAEFPRVYGRGKAMESLGVFVAMVVGGFVAESGYRLPLILSALAPLLGVILVLVFIREPARTFERTEKLFSATLKSGLKSIVSKRPLLLITLMMSLFLGVAGVVDEYVGPLLAETDVLPLSSIGVVYGIILGTRAVGAALAHRVAGMALNKIAWLILFAHTLLLGGQLAGGLSLAGLCASYFLFMGAVEVLLETHLQQQIESQARATITSVAGAGLEVSGIVLFFTIGLIADASQWAVAIAWVAGVAMVICGLLIPVLYSVAPRSRS